MDSDEDQQALAWQWIIRNKAFDNVRVQRGESWVDAACRTLDELIDQKEQAEKSLEEEKSRSQFFAARADEANGERDAEASRADYLYKKLAKLMSDYQDIEDERDEWKDRATPAVTKAEIEKAIRSENLFERQIDAVWPLVSGDEPAAYVVRESDVSAVEVKRNAEGDWWTKNRGCGEGATADGMRQMAEILIRDATEYEAIARAIEAEKAVDPIEAKAWELYEHVYVGPLEGASFAVQTEYRKLAAYVLGQEDRHVDQ